MRRYWINFHGDKFLTNKNKGILQIRRRLKRFIVKGEAPIPGSITPHQNEAGENSSGIK
jgi:hypothetical protein